MRQGSSKWLAALMCLAVAGLTVAQEKSDVPLTIRTDTRLVVLHASVIDTKGKPVPKLPQKAFKVFENGTPQEIKGFQQEDVPISLGLIIDNSGSMRPKRQKVEAAALAFVKASNPRDEVFIVNFNDEAFLDQEFTSDQKKMEEKLARIDSRGGTAMRDAISMSIDYMKESGKKDKKVLMVITDGNDNNSRGTLERLVQKCQQTDGVLVYAIGLLNEEARGEAKKAQKALNAITVGSGGVAYYPKAVSEMDPYVAQIAADIRSQYTITYRPSNEALDGSFRQIRMTVDGPGIPRCERAPAIMLRPRARRLRLLLRQARHLRRGRSYSSSLSLQPVIHFLWLASRGYWLTPWRSPYLRWRIETYWGIPAETMTAGEFWRFVFLHRGELLRFLRWAERMGVSAGC